MDRNRDVRALVVEVLSTIAPDGDFDSLDPRASLRAQLDLDSLDFMAYVEQLSERTGAPIPEEEYPLVDTLNGCAEVMAAVSPPSLSSAPRAAGPGTLVPTQARRGLVVWSGEPLEETTEEGGWP